MKAVAVSGLFLATSVAAQAPVVPQVIRAVQEQKGAWEVEALDAAWGRNNPRTICAEDPVAAISYETRPSPCSRKLIRDTTDEAISERVCPQNVSRTVLTRDGKNLFMHISNLGPHGQQLSKWRFTALGACREGSK